MIVSRGYELLGPLRRIVFRWSVQHSLRRKEKQSSFCLGEVRESPEGICFWILQEATQWLIFLSLRMDFSFPTRWKETAVCHTTVICVLNILHDLNVTRNSSVPCTWGLSRSGFSTEFSPSGSYSSGWLEAGVASPRACEPHATPWSAGFVVSVLWCKQKIINGFEIMLLYKMHKVFDTKNKETIG